VVVGGVRCGVKWCCGVAVSGGVRCGVEWSGGVRCGVVWSDVEWCGVEWWCAVWCGVVVWEVWVVVVWGGGVGGVVWEVWVMCHGPWVCGMGVCHGRGGVVVRCECVDRCGVSGACEWCGGVGGCSAGGQQPRSFTRHQSLVTSL
jgi:hypothetical protein